MNDRLPGSPSRTSGRPSLYLILGIALVAFVLLAGVGAALTFRQRVGAQSGDWTPPALTSTPGTPAAVAQVTATLSAATTAEATATATISLSPSPTAQPTPECRVEVAPELVPLYSQSQLGCAYGPAAVVWSAWEPFERGGMFWRSDTDEAYILMDDGRWWLVTEPWTGEPPVGRGEPPAGLTAPERGFGWVWSNNDAVFEKLGWASDTEKGFCAILQTFARGFLVRGANVASCTSDQLYNFAAEPSWRPLALAVHETGWQRANLAAVAAPTTVAVPIPAMTPAPDATATTGAPLVARPADQGRFTAAALSPTLDGDFSEWPAAWQPVTAVVSGRQEWSGEDDLAAAFQLAWDPDGLYLALEVTDDAYRPGPQDTRMWRGDGIEINLDRDLAGDFEDASSSADDYQIGLSYGPGLADPRGYRWLPFAEEAMLAIEAVAVETATGYVVEARIPWSVFGVTAPAAGATFGFNLAVNDNDGATPAQETVLASSPARLSHDNPTQWGTLILGGSRALLSGRAALIAAMPFWTSNLPAGAAPPGAPPAAASSPVASAVPATAIPVAPATAAPTAPPTSLPTALPPTAVPTAPPTAPPAVPTVPPPTAPTAPPTVPTAPPPTAAPPAVPTAPPPPTTVPPPPPTAAPPAEPTANVDPGGDDDKPPKPTRKPPKPKETPPGQG